MNKIKLRDHIEIAYECFGHGEPLLLIMGIGCQMIFWEDAFCEQLAGHGFRVIRFDNRDCGQSTFMDDFGTPNLAKIIAHRLARKTCPSPYTLLDMAGDAIGLMDALGIDRAHWVGMSLGGMVAQCAAISHSDRVRSLANIMAGPGDLWAALPKRHVWNVLALPTPTERDETVETLTRIWSVIGFGDHGTAPERLGALAATAFDRMPLSPSGYARQMAAVLGSPSRMRELSRIRAPTVVIHGSADPLVPPLAGRIVASRIPGARLSIIEGMKHDLGPSTWPHVIDSIVRNARRTVPQNAKALGLLRALRTPSVRLGAEKLSATQSVGRRAAYV